uniref:Uncharacterized protein n=1 Tax=Oryctolagus cuniculus TaxID=9986 RepID=A0A5F9C756_RABIT
REFCWACLSVCEGGKVSVHWGGGLSSSLLPAPTSALSVCLAACLHVHTHMRTHTRTHTHCLASAVVSRERERGHQGYLLGSRPPPPPISQGICGQKVRKRHRWSS